MKSQEKITKEMNYILGNQDSIQAQITQVESGIAQTEVHSIGVLIILWVFMRQILHPRVYEWCENGARMKLQDFNQIQELFSQCPVLEIAKYWIS